ncbi:ABC transporter, ATP-binding protein [Labilithrix luteola]|uniref:ABC transporter, ATP-binding protein n=2 Tax=Labilithrix luteola TaxID=1391654 RepID=A0A0K1PM57_9BACT|nr:ABC transporter, ATP-binding protein [Labilithrix luteola]
MLDVRGLTIGWGEVPLIRNITFRVNRGEVFGILGGSGSGKSTLLRFLIGLEPVKTGEIDVAGNGPPNLDDGLPPYGVMFQSGALFGSMNVVENVALPLEEWTDLPPDAIRAIARAKLRIVGLEAAAEKSPAELSGGMRKRAAIARALALEPSLVFLDEPSSGLDPITSAELDELILTLSRALGLTVVVVTHQLDSIFRIADRVLMLDRPSRSVIAIGDPRALRDSDDPRVRDFFNPDAVAERIAREH